CCVQLWGPQHKKDMDLLDILQECIVVGRISYRATSSLITTHSHLISIMLKYCYDE
ncbi:unnamed protein product, partial [Bubo scandiacus]